MSKVPLYFNKSRMERGVAQGVLISELMSSDF